MNPANLTLVGEDQILAHNRPGCIFARIAFRANFPPVHFFAAIMADILVTKQIAHDPRFVVSTRGATL